MNATTRADLDSIPIPFEDGSPLRACVIGGLDTPLRLAWAFDGGRRKETFGPVYATAREAARASRYINQRGAS